MDQARRAEARTVEQSDSISNVLEHVRQALRGLRFGHVSLIVQDGRVVQVDRFEKTRLTESTNS